MTLSSINYQELAENIELWGLDLGFSQVGISDVDLSAQEGALQSWIDNKFHGNMYYMEQHGLMRARPAELEPGSIRAICVRLDYLPTDAKFAQILKSKDKAYISRYALGRDYHKMMRKRLKLLGQKISEYCNEFSYRPFVDSAPILERPLAEKSGLGWVGKHSLLINKQAGSWFFLGELLVNIPLPISTMPGKASPEQDKNDCGNCVACIKICPTDAIVAPYIVDARRCISYLTIESADPIPVELRPLMGNRIYGCDDCQLICPWNKYAKLSKEEDFQTRHNLDDISLLELFSWDKDYFLTMMEGSPIRRIGYQSWQRNIAVALGNAPYDENIVSTLKKQLPKASDLVNEHISWALEQQQLKSADDYMEISDGINTKLIRTVEKALPRDA